MNKIIALVIVFSCLFAAGCGGISRGKVVAKDFIPEHQEEYTESVYDGQDCGYKWDSFEGEHRYQCTNRYRDVRRMRTVPDAWYVSIRACDKEKPDKCKTSKVVVSKTVYNEVRKGDIYDSETSEIIKQ